MMTSWQHRIIQPKLFNKFLLINVNEFIKWSGGELQSLFLKTDVTNRFALSQDLVTRAINLLSKKLPRERGQISNELITSLQSGKIGDFQVPFDVRGDIDTIEAIYATMKGYLEY